MDIIISLIHKYSILFLAIASGVDLINFWVFPCESKVSYFVFSFPLPMFQSFTESEWLHVGLVSFFIG